MTDAERIEQIKELIKTYGHKWLHASDVQFLLKLAERTLK